MDVILAKYYALTPKQRKTVAEKFLEILDENEETRKKSGKKSVAKFKRITKLEVERDTFLYNKLRAWRNQTAEAAGLDVKTEAWQVMKNEPLMNIAFYRPENKEEFLRLDGMTEEIFDSYGKSILEIVSGKALPPKPSIKAKTAKTQSKKPVHIPETCNDELEPEDAMFTAPSKLQWFLPSNK